jgi:hypothetical protein
MFADTQKYEEGVQSSFLKVPETAMCAMSMHGDFFADKLILAQLGARRWCHGKWAGRTLPFMSVYR